MQIRAAVLRRNPNPNPDLKCNLKSIAFDSVEDYYCAKFQVIPISGFHFIVLTFTRTHPICVFICAFLFVCMSPFFYVSLGS